MRDVIAPKIQFCYSKYTLSLFYFFVDMNKHLPWYWEKYLLLWIQIGAVLFSIEILVMLILPLVGKFNSTVLEALTDAGLLSFLATPICFLLLRQAVKTQNPSYALPELHLKAKMLRLFLGPYVLCALLISAFIIGFYYNERSDFKNRLQEKGLQTLKVPIHRLEKEMQEAQQELLYLAGNLGENEGIPQPHLRHMLHDFIRMHPRYAQAIWLAPDGSFLLQGGEQVLLPIQGGLFLNFSKERQFGFLPLWVVQQGHGQAFLPLMAPINNQAGRNQGYFLLFYRLQPLLNDLAFSFPSKDYLLYLINTNNRWVIDVINDKLYQKAESDAFIAHFGIPLTQLVAQESQPTQDGYLFGHNYVLPSIEDSQTNPNTPIWTLVLEQKPSVLQYAISNLRLRSLALFLGLIALETVLFSAAIIAWVRREQTHHQLVLAKDEAKKAFEVKSRFLANMSHEIRTPLNSILGFSEILQQRLHDEENREFLNSILISGNVLLTLINDILDLSKIEADRLSLELRPLDLSQLFFEIQQVFIHKIHSKGLSFKVRLQEGLPNFYLDEVRLRQILLNLVGNAIKFTERGEIILEAKGTKQTQEGTWSLQIKVIDSGMGIPLGQQEHIFEAFAQQSGQSYSKYGGTGLGLAICKKLIMVMEGDLNLESKLGEGSCFLLTLPQVQASDTPLPMTPEDEELYSWRFQPASILLADDLEIHRKLLSSMLADQPFRILEAKNEEELLRLAHREKPDLILLDMTLSQVVSPDLAEALHCDPHTTQIPLISLSASILPEEISFQKQHFDHILLKPFSKKELFLALRRLLPIQEQKIVRVLPPAPSTSKDLKVLSNWFNQDALQQWETVQSSSVIDKMEAFLKEIQIQASGHEEVLSWAEKGLTYARRFDVENLKNHIAEFPKQLKIILAQQGF